MENNYINVIGAGLAGCEAAWLLSRLKVNVHLYEMKPVKRSPAHKSDNYGELVCSNSLKANNIDNATGLLKEELRRLGSLIIEAADKTAVPAGGALAVDRDDFSQYITDKINSSEYITVINEPVTKIPDDAITIVATGPLTDGELFQDIVRITGADDLHFLIHDRN